ncbi:serine/threonine protein kinase, partial [bacterium]|nr:serine/threonine protein kinase [bacterium]
MPFHQLQIGTILSHRYHIDAVIGQGGMGAVYRATDQSLGISVALKQSLVPLHDPHAQQIMRREAQLLARLEHPNLPNVTNYFHDQYGQFLVMQYLAGPDLGAMLDQQVATYGKPFVWPQVQPWATDLLKVLDYLHSKGIIHRDIKPSNLKLASDGRVMLLDFGLAKGSDSTTMMHSYKGFTRHYASFEQQQGITTDARSDLYSLAATLYALLSAQLPSDALSRMRVKSKQALDPLPPLHRVSPEVPRAVSDVIMHALALEPDDRPQSAQAMLARLQQAAPAAAPQPAPPPSASQTLRSTPTRPAPAPPAPTQGFPFLPVILSGTGALVFLVMLALILSSAQRDASNADNSGGLQPQNSGGRGTEPPAATEQPTAEPTAEPPAPTEPPVPQPVSVPNVVGLLAGDAYSILASRGLQGAEFSQSVPGCAPFVVVSQDPAAGATSPTRQCRSVWRVPQGRL